uniref:Uncharacterized protein n=1 Tax=Lepeophtheirus salmonis TaxID=72036 RepID=A0A0K2TQ48_LEPSM
MRDQISFRHPLNLTVTQAYDHF